MTKMQNEKIHECKIILCVTNPTATLLAIKPDMDKEFGIESKLAVINGKLEIIIKANNLKSLMKTSSFVFERVKLSEDTIKFSEENDLLN